MRLCVIIMMLISLPGYGQYLRDSAQIELEPTRHHQLIPVEHQGVLIFSNRITQRRVKEQTWTFSLYDELFNPKWNKNITVDGKYDYEAYYYGQGNLYLIFNRYKKKRLKVLKIDVSTGELKTKDVETFARFDIVDFKAINDKLFIDARLINSPTLIHADLETGKVRALSTAFRGYPKVTRVDVFPELKKVNVVSVNKTRDHRDLLVKVYSDMGKEEESYRVRPDEGKRLINGKISEINNDLVFVIGTYLDEGEVGERGFFVSGFKGKKQLFNKYYAFSGLETFDKYMSGGDSAVGEAVSLPYLINPHTLVKRGEEYLMVAEAYYPTYRRESHTFFDAAGLPITTYYKVFDGWQYTHGLLSAISTEGDLMWSNTFDIDKVRIDDMRDMITLTSIKDHQALVYINDGKTVFQVIPNQNEIVVSEEVPDTGVSLAHTNIEHWYSNYYISWTIENVKDKGNKKIVRCNKIDFE